MACDVPPQPNLISIYVDSKTESETLHVGNVSDGKDKVLIGRLNLQGLGIKNQISRRFGYLNTLFIARHSSKTSSIDDEED
jgi:hypothetical protein